MTMNSVAVSGLEASRFSNVNRMLLLPKKKKFTQNTITPEMARRKWKAMKIMIYGAIKRRENYASHEKENINYPTNACRPTAL